MSITDIIPNNIPNMILIDILSFKNMLERIVKIIIDPITWDGYAIDKGIFLKTHK